MKADEIVAAYQAGKPTRKNSKQLVKDIALAQGITTAKVRGILTRAGVYVAQPSITSVILNDEQKVIVDRLVILRGVGDKHVVITPQMIKELSDEFGYKTSLIVELKDEWEKYKFPVSGDEFIEHRRNTILGIKDYEKPSSLILSNDPAPPLDGCTTWVIRITFILMATIPLFFVYTCMTFDLDAGKSDLQKKCERLLQPQGYRCS